MDIQVVLTENDAKLGKRGQVVKVSAGFAQNFLFPHQKAMPATPANLQKFDREKAKASKEEGERLAEAKELSQRIEALELKMDVTVGDGDRLFGSVTSQDLVDALSQKKILLDRKKIHLEEPIKRLGQYQIPVKLHPQVIANLKVQLVKRS